MVTRMNDLPEPIIPSHCFLNHESQSLHPPDPQEVCYPSSLRTETRYKNRRPELSDREIENPGLVRSSCLLHLG